MMNHIHKIYNILFKEYGPQRWWPCKSSKHLEIIFGAILTQNTSWKNVETAIDNLIAHDLICIDKIQKINKSKLASLIRSAGYYNQKADRLKIIAGFLSKNTNPSREQLLNVKGIGPETADSILLYAFHRPVFVIDTYTKRIFSRIGICKKDIKYEDLQNIFIGALPKTIDIYNEYHALIVELAKRHCKTKPICSSCPLNKICKKRIK